MKTSARISFAALTAALIIVAFCFSACPPKPEDKTDANDWTFDLKIQKTPKQDYAPVVDKKKFDEALCNLKKDNNKKGDYNIDYKPSADATPIPNYQPDCSQFGSVSLEKNTNSALADNSFTEGSAANDPNATQHVRVDSPNDLAAVLAAFATPTPAAGH